MFANCFEIQMKCEAVTGKSRTKIIDGRIEFTFENHNKTTENHILRTNTA